MPPPLRVALVTETYPPEVNGAAMTLERFARGLVARGHQVQVVRPRQSRRDAPRSEPPAYEERLTAGMPLPFYAELRLGLPSRDFLRRLWRTRPPDVIHVATEGFLGWSALGAAADLRLPVVSSFHTNFQEYGRHYRLGFLQPLGVRVLRRFHNRTALTMVPSEDQRAALTALGFERVVVVARGVDTVLYHPERRRPELRTAWGAAPEDPVVLYVGRLAAEKNIRLAVEAAGAMRALHPRLRFLLVGDGPERAAIARMDPAAVFAGMRRGVDLAAHYASGDLMLFPSLTETFGNVLTEALASGVPVLAFDYAAARVRIRHGHNGWVVPKGDTAGYLEQARALARDPGSWPAAGVAARASVLDFGWDAITARLESLLRTGAAAHRAAAATVAAATA